MMSKERELLKKILATGWLNNTISCEVEELLAQPEQTEQITFKDDADKIAHLENSVELLAGLLDAKKRAPFYVNGVRYTELDQIARLTAENAMLKEKWLAQPEHTEQKPVAWKDRTYGNLHHVDYGNSIPLYSAPISDITGEELMKQVKSNRVFYQEGYAQAELDLKRSASNVKGKK